MQIGPQERQQNARHSAARTHIEHRAGLAGYAGLVVCVSTISRATNFSQVVCRVRLSFLPFHSQSKRA